MNGWIVLAIFLLAGGVKCIQHGIKLMRENEDDENTATVVPFERKRR